MVRLGANVKKSLGSRGRSNPHEKFVFGTVVSEPKPKGEGGTITKDTQCVVFWESRYPTPRPRRNPGESERPRLSVEYARNLITRN